MGKVEKVIVLSVLFVVALILVVTLTVDDPLDKEHVVEAGGRQTPAAGPGVAQAPARTPTSGNPLLSTNVQPSGPAAAVPAPAAPVASVPAAPGAVQPAGVPLAGLQPASPQPGATPGATLATPGAQPAAPAAASPSAGALPPGALLRTTEGLQDSWFPELKLYTWKEGDTWRQLANTYYGDWQRLDVLKRSNEGRMDVAPGESVFIPVFADERAKNAALAGATGAAAGSTAPAASSAAQPAAAGGARIHVVADGESLWIISKKVLGDGSRWKEIYEANRDILKKPESIQKGMRLRIP
jgi:nucleoid-associated protein YgaU